MRNIDYKEDQGPGVARRILAFLAIVLGLAVAAGYQYFFAHGEYQSRLTLLTRDPAACDLLLAEALQSENRPKLLSLMDGSASVAAALDDAVQAGKDSAGRSDNNNGLHKFVSGFLPQRQWCELALDGIGYVKKPDHLLEITSRECATPFQSDKLTGTLALQALQQFLEIAARKQSIQRTQQAVGSIDKQRQELASRAGSLTEKYAVAPATVAALKDLAAAGNGQGFPGGGWQVAFPEGGETGRIVGALEQQLQQSRELARQLARDQEQCAGLEKWISAPENQSVIRRTKRVVYHEDSPDLVRLKDQKAQLEAARMRLLERATTRHPLALKMSEQINELQAQIEAMTRLPEVVEDVVQETNPELNNWQKQLADAQAALRGNVAKLTLVRKNILTLTGDLQRAEEQQRRTALQNEKLQLQDKLKALSDQAPATGGELPFTVFLPAGRPQLLKSPTVWPVYACGLGCGTACAVLLLLSRRRTRFHVIDKPEEVLPEYPVLGSIPLFGSEGHLQGYDKAGAASGSRKESA